MKANRSFFLDWCRQPERIQMPQIRGKLQLSVLMSVLLVSSLTVGLYWASFPSMPPGNPASAAPPVGAEIQTVPTVSANVTTTEADSEINVESTHATCSTLHFEIDLTYPNATKPGDPISILVKAKAKVTVQIRELTLNLYAYTSDGSLLRIGQSEIVKKKLVRSGDSWSQTFNVTVPSDIPRSTLIGSFTEVWDEPIYYVIVVYNDTVPAPVVIDWWSWGPDPYYWWGRKGAWPYGYYYDFKTFSVSSEPVALSYVLAATPEYVRLKSEDEALAVKYSDLESMYNGLASKYNSLSREYNSTSKDLSKLKATHEATVLDLTATRNYMYIFATSTLALAALAIFLIAIRRRPLRKQKTPSSVLTEQTG